MHDLLAGASLPHAPPLPPPPLARLAGVGWALRGSGETVPPPRRADLSRRALYLHSFEFTTDLGRDQRENGSSLLNQGVMAKKKKKKPSLRITEGTRLRGQGPEWVCPGRCAFAFRGAPSTRNVARGADLPEVGPGRTLAQGDTREARLSTEGCLALVTIFGLVRRQLGRLAFNCLQERRRFPTCRCYRRCGFDEESVVNYQPTKPFINR